jgi:hypothetical protein
VTRRGVRIDRVTGSADALVAAHAGDTTLFIPAPSLMHPFYLRMLKLLPPSTAVVLVAPGARELADGRLPVGVSDRRLATEPAAPDCQLPAATRAGTAGVHRVRYTTVDGPYAAELARCYGGSLVRMRWHGTVLTAVGANDPFRNDRIGEHGNAGLATALLTGAPRLVWLDLHGPEPRPGLITDPSVTAGAGAPPSIGPGTPDPDFPIPDGSDPGGTPRPGGGSGNNDDEPSNPLWRAFPPWVWAGLVLLLAAGALLALASARRLGAPVPEPLPVTVPAAETVRGRGRLYQRAKARTVAIGTLRTAARERLARLLDLPTDTPVAELAAAVAARTGTPVDDVLAVLDGPVEEEDTDLVRVAAALDALQRAVAQPAGEPAREGEQW